MKNAGRKIYDTYSSLVGGMLSLLSPIRAARFRFGRDMYRSYLSGSVAGPDQGFVPWLRSADTEVKAAYKLTSARCRDQYRNNSLISGGIERICNNVVRTGIYPQFLFRDRAGKLDRKNNTVWEKMFRRWSIYCDITGHDSYSAMLP